MKTLLSIAATLVAFTSISAASAQTRGPGHWEWQSRPAPGPSKSNLPSRVRVWVKDAPTVANCDCSMMKADASGCIMDMHGKAETPSAH